MTLIENQKNDVDDVVNNNQQSLPDMAEEVSILAVEDNESKKAKLDNLKTEIPITNKVYLEFTNHLEIRYPGELELQSQRKTSLLEQALLLGIRELNKELVSDTSSSLSIDERKIRADELQQLGKIANLLQQHPEYPNFRLEDIARIIRVAIGQRCDRTIHKYLVSIQSLSFFDKNISRHNVENFCHTILASIGRSKSGD